MARKILLSFLGTNNYLDCNYYIDSQPDKIVENVKYIQDALVQLYAKDFTKQDQILLFLTEKAEKMNFWDNGQLNHQTKGSNLQNVGLHSKLGLLQNKGFQFEINHKRIKEGFSQEEVWSIFQTIADEIQDDDQIILDITHAFRFLPMLGIVLLNYLKTTKNISVLGIHYGAFEKLGSFQEVKEMNIEDRNAPIIDLKTLLEFQSWTSAVNSFVKFGEVGELKSNSHNQINSILSLSKGKDESAKDLRYVIGEIDKLSSNIQTNRLNAIIEQDFSLFNEKLNKLSDQEIAVKPYKQILKLLQKKAEPLVISKDLVWLESAKWCLEHHMVQQAYTQLQEGLLTHSIKIFQNKILSSTKLNEVFETFKISKNPKIANYSDRKFYSELLNFIYKTSQNNIKDSDELRLVELSKVLQNEFFIKLGTTFAHISEPRNDINHGGMREDPMKSESLEKRIRELIVQVSNLFDKN